MKNEKTFNIDTMIGVGKKKEIAGREYTILPVTIRDMHYVIGNDPDNRLIIVDKDKLDEDDVNWQIFGLNIVDENKKKILMEVIENYLIYKDHPMNEELLLEHGWSFKEIGEFLRTWCQVSD